jgi:hypothetical protein
MRNESVGMERGRVKRRERGRVQFCSVRISHTVDMGARRRVEEQKPWIPRTVPAQQL